MDWSEIIELRRLFKTYKETGCPVNGLSGGFIDTEGSIKGYFSMPRFHDLGSAVKKRIFTIASKTISNNSVTLPVKAGARELFEKIAATKGANMELAEELCERVSKAIGISGHTNAYAVNILGYTYDPPAKTKDHRTIIDGVSDEIFNFFVCMVSPVSTSKASYGYFSEKEEFGMNPLLHIVENPAAGFVYPDFTGRTSDFDSVLYFRTEKLDISKELFGAEAPELPKKEKKENAVVREADITGTVPKIPEPSFPEHDTVPSLDTGTLSMEEVRGRDIAAERHGDDEEKERLKLREQDGREDSTNNTYNKAAREPARVRKVHISGNTKGLIKRMVDGVMCFIVPVSEADVE